MKQLDELEQSAWEGFLTVHSRIWRVMERHLADEVGLSLTEYDMLLKLRRAGRKGLRMSELASQLLMSSGGFTRLADRLQRQGLIERHRSPEDGRGFIAQITPAGRKTMRRANAVHLGDVHGLFLEQLSEEDLRHLASAWAKVGVALGKAEP